MQDQQEQARVVLSARTAGSTLAQAYLLRELDGVSRVTFDRTRRQLVASYDPMAVTARELHMALWPAQPKAAQSPGWARLLPKLARVMWVVAAGA